MKHLEHVIDISRQAVAAADSAPSDTERYLDARGIALRELVHVSGRDALDAALVDGHALAEELRARRDKALEELAGIATAIRMLTTYSASRPGASVNRLG